MRDFLYAMRVTLGRLGFGLAMLALSLLLATWSHQPTSVGHIQAAQAPQIQKPVVLTLPAANGTELQPAATTNTIQNATANLQPAVGGEGQ